MITTIETRLRVDLAQAQVLDESIDLLSWAYRKMWSLYNREKKTESEIYHTMMSLNTLTCQQVKSLIYKIKGDRNRLREITKTQLKQSQERLEQVQKFCDKKTQQIKDHEALILKLKKPEPSKSLMAKQSSTNKTALTHQIKELPSQSPALMTPYKKLDHKKIASLTKSISNTKRLLKAKNQKIKRISEFIDTLKTRIDSNTFKFCFGSSKLLSQKPGNAKDRFRQKAFQKPYASVQEWQADWNLARNNQWFSVGDKSQPQGNPEVQYDPALEHLRLRLPEQIAQKRLLAHSIEQNIDLEKIKTLPKLSRFRTASKFLEIPHVVFCHKNAQKLQAAIHNKQPITTKILKRKTPNQKEIGYYLQISFEEVILPAQNVNPPIKIMGVDLNQEGLAFCVVKPDGNKLPQNQGHGFLSWDLYEKSSAQREWLISNTISELLAKATALQVSSIAIENLDFSSKFNKMGAGYKNDRSFNKMLSNFASTKFKEQLIRKAERLGLKIAIVNPIFSSVGGFTKFGLINKLPVDISASFWLARQALLGTSFKKENHITWFKKHSEEIAFPYLNLSKQSKTKVLDKIKWKDVSSALGRYRKFWYKNTMIYLQSKVDLALLDQDPFEDPALNLKKIRSS